MSNYIPRYRKPTRSSSKAQTTSSTGSSSSERGVLKFLARVLGVILVALIVAGVWYISRWEALNVSEIRVEGSETLASEIASRSEDYLDVRSGRIRNARNVFLVPVQGLQKYLLQEFPAIAEISITRSVSGVVAIQVTQREVVLAQCREDRCVRVGEDGVAVEYVSRDQISDEMVVVGEELVRPGEVQFDAREVAWFQTIQQMYQSELGIPVREVQLSLIKDDSILEVRVVSEEGYFIRLDFETDVVYQGEVLRRVFASELPQERRSEVEYIDLRVRNRAYYKLRSQNGETEATIE